MESIGNIFEIQWHQCNPTEELGSKHDKSEYQNNHVSPFQGGCIIKDTFVFF